MRWKPFEDVLIRANYAQGFRAPSVFDLFSGPVNLITAGGLVDPCAPVGDTPPDPAVATRCRALAVPGTVSQPFVVAITQGNNPLLRPETARSYSFGAAWSPAWLPNLDATVDWYDIRLRNAIGQRDAQFFIDDCYVTGDPVSCTHVTRNVDRTKSARRSGA
jgi:iron complex outermembrane receptor protein